AVQVVQRCVAHPPDGDDGVGCERLTGDEQRPQRGERVRVGRGGTRPGGGAAGGGRTRDWGPPGPAAWASIPADLIPYSTPHGL
uniref:hypothetical protein n=1 Tax=Nocardia asiatica TaxID=209252 RepID=UPI002453F88C